MRLSQKLYEEGYITYMRTDSKFYCEDFLRKMEKYAKNEYGNKYFNDNIEFKTNVGAQEAHESIRPTNIEIKNVELGNKENRLYELIRNSTIESCLKRCNI